MILKRKLRETYYIVNSITNTQSQLIILETSARGMIDKQIYLVKNAAMKLLRERNVVEYFIEL